MTGRLGKRETDRNSSRETGGDGTGLETERESQLVF